MKKIRIIQVIISVIAAIVLLVIAFGKSVLYLPFGSGAIEYPYINALIKSDHGGFRENFVTFLWLLLITMLLSVVFTWIKKKIFSLLTTAICTGIAVYDIIMLVRVKSSQGNELNDWLFLLFPIIIAIMSLVLVRNLKQNEVGGG